MDQDFLNDQAKPDGPRVARYDLAQRFYNGDESFRLDDRQKAFLEREGVPFVENFTEPTVDALSRRLRIVGFEVEDNPQASDWLTKTWWGRGRGSAVRRVVHTNTLILGDGVLVGAWNERTKLPTVRWNQPHGAKPTYDESTGDLLHLAKCWSTKQKSATNPEGRESRRLNLYYPDRIEKYVTFAADEEAIWQEHRDTPDEPWPTPWTKGDGPEGLGVAAIPFRYRALGGTYGRSRALSVASFQLELNKQLVDLFDVMDWQGAPTVTATGVGTSEPLKIGRGKMLRAQDSAARFGTLDAADPVGLLEVAKSTLARWSARAGVPLHELITGTPPSGESQKTAEGSLVAEADDTADDFTAPWGDVGRLMLNMAAEYGDLDFTFDPDANVVPVWDDTETRNERDEAEIALIDLELGASSETLLRRRGYDPDAERKLRDEETKRTATDPPPPPGDPTDPPAND